MFARVQKNFLIQALIKQLLTKYQICIAPNFTVIFQVFLQASSL